MSLRSSSNKADPDYELKHAEESAGAPGEVVALDSEAVKKLRWKCDLHLLPPLTVVYFLSFMDRTNIGSFSHPGLDWLFLFSDDLRTSIGNAKIQGMTEDLKMQGTDYNMALFTFFIPVHGPSTPAG